MIMPAHGIAKSVWVTQFVRQRPHTGMTYMRTECGCLLICYWRGKAAGWRCRQQCAEHAAMPCQMCGSGERTAWFLVRQLERTRESMLMDGAMTVTPLQEYSMLCHACFSTRYIRENPNWRESGWCAMSIWRE